MNQILSLFSFRTFIGLVVFGGLLGVIVWGTEFFKVQEEQNPHGYDNLTPRQRADLAWETRQWRVARDNYETVLTQDEFNATAWFRLGYSQHQQKDLDAALESYSRATAFKRVRGWAQYNSACICATSGRLDEAIELLRDAVEGGLVTRRGIKNDPDFASLADDPEFLRLAMIDDQRRSRSRR